MVRVAEVELHASKGICEPCIPCELLAPLRRERLERASLQKPEGGLRDAPAVVVALFAASSLDALSASTSRHTGPAATSVSSAHSMRQDLSSACFGLSSTVWKISILPLVLGLLLRILFPFLRRWRLTLPNASGSRQLEGGGYGPAGKNSWQAQRCTCRHPQA